MGRKYFRTQRHHWEDSSKENNGPHNLKLYFSDQPSKENYFIKQSEGES